MAENTEYESALRRASTEGTAPIDITNLRMEDVLGVFKRFDPDGTQSMRARLFNLAERMDKAQLTILLAMAEWQVRQESGFGTNPVQPDPEKTTHVES
jgi:hypothetical protein